MGLPQISTGDLFRENLKNETELGRLARQYMDAGELVPDEVTVGMVRERLNRPDTEAGAIFDGFPRTIAQAGALKELLAENDDAVNVVPYIHVDPDLLLKRLAGRWTCPVCGRVYHELFNPPQEEGICDVDGAELYQREDDTVETQRRRIEVYFEQTAPLLDYYRQKGLLVQIDGEQPIDEVFQELKEAIEKHQ
jgi:adenylate kinase